MIFAEGVTKTVCPACRSFIKFKVMNKSELITYSVIQMSESDQKLCDEKYNLRSYKDFQTV